MSLCLYRRNDVFVKPKMLSFVMDWSKPLYSSLINLTYKKNNEKYL